jgi:hypothetical protein
MSSSIHHPLERSPLRSTSSIKILFQPDFDKKHYYHHSEDFTFAFSLSRFTVAYFGLLPKISPTIITTTTTRTTSSHQHIPHNLKSICTFAWKHFVRRTHRSSNSTSFIIHRFHFPVFSFTSIILYTVLETSFAV